MKKEELTPKQAEIKALEDLFLMDGYFVDYFTADDLGIMISNIKNDFPLLYGTNPDLEVQALRKELDAEIEAKEEAIRMVNKQGELLENKTSEIEGMDRIIYSLTNKRLDLLDDLVQNNGAILLTDHFTEAEIISAKLRKKVALTEEEIVYVLPKL